MSPETAGETRTPDARFAVLSRRLADETDPAVLLRPLGEELRTKHGFDRVSLYCFNQRDQELFPVLQIDEAGVISSAGRAVSVSTKHPMGALAKGEQPSFSVPTMALAARAGLGPEVHSAAGAPLRAGGDLVGVIWAERLSPAADQCEDPLTLLLPYSRLVLVPLFALYQRQRDLDLEKAGYAVASEILFAASDNRICLVSDDVMDGLWSSDLPLIAVRDPEDVKPVRDAAREAAERAGLADTRMDDFALCASEAATNALVHGGGGAAACAGEPEVARAWICDSGPGIPVSMLTLAVLKTGWSGAGSLGVGFTIITRTASRLYIATRSGGTRLIIEMSTRFAPAPTQAEEISLEDLDISLDDI